jgi:hypothetical protein
LKIFGRPEWKATSKLCVAHRNVDFFVDLRFLVYKTSLRKFHVLNEVFDDSFLFFSPGFGFLDLILFLFASLIVFILHGFVITDRLLGEIEALLNEFVDFLLLVHAFLVGTDFITITFFDEVGIGIDVEYFLGWWHQVVKLVDL